MRVFLQKLCETAAGLIFPAHCAYCKAACSPGCWLCPTCAAQAPRVGEPRCRTCSQPFDGMIEQPFACPNCTDRVYHLECIVSPYRSKGVVRDYIHRLKYAGDLYLRSELANWMAEALTDERITRRDFVALIPVPLHRRRERQREFNQARELAQLLSEKCGKPVWDDLIRQRYTTPQALLDRDGRMENLRGAFTLRQGALVSDCHLLLVDDVLTTGSTLDECARVLRRAGAASVRAITVARA